MNRTTRRIYFLVMGLIIVLLAISAKLGAEALAFLLGVALVGWWFFGVFLSRLIGSMLITSIRCPGCQLEVPAVSQWKVGSYTDHRERHFLFAKDPVSGMRIGQIDCPQCSCTILL